MSDRHYVHHEDEVALAKILKESKPWIEQYGTTLIYGVAAVLAIAAVVVYVARRPPATAEESSMLLLASTPEDYQAVADAAPDSPIGTLARLRQAELLMANAASNLFTNRKVGVEELDKAATTYQRLEERKDLDGSVRERVLAGMARVLEARCDGTEAATKEAVGAWEKLLKEFPESTMFKDIAKSRIEQLPQESTKAFYAWFQQQDPKPGDDLQLPQDGPPAVPDIPSISIPDLTTPAPAKSDMPAEEKSAEEKPAAPSEEPKADAEKDAAAPAKPEEAKPAEEPKPEEPKPEEPKADATPEKAEEAKPAPAEEQPAAPEVEAKADAPAAEKSAE
jgi:hypothetical protein